MRSQLARQSRLATRSFSAAARPFPPRLASSDRREPNERDPKTSILIELIHDKPGQLNNVLSVFENHGTNVTHIESRLQSYSTQGPLFYIDFEGKVGEPRVDTMLSDMDKLGMVTVTGPRQVPWFPVNIRELDLTKDTMGSDGDGLINEDHPGFSDQEYMSRRKELAALADDYAHGKALPHIEYNDNEKKTWGAVYKKLTSLSSEYACKEYLYNLDRMEKYCGYAESNVPQLQDISNFLQQETGFTLRPVQGLLSARDFLNALAFRVFFSTQYIRHHGNPFYTPEPDICHELMGHAPMFADRDFADFSQQIGLASLAASDEDVDKLASCYWFTVEFGLVQEEGAVKAFGAGLLSSFGEMEWSCADKPSHQVREMGGMITNFPNMEKPEIRPFEPTNAATQEFPITTYQPIYFMAESMMNMKERMNQFCDLHVHQPFYPQYDPLTQSIRVTKSVFRSERTSTLELQAKKQKEYFDSLKPGEESSTSLGVDGPWTNPVEREASMERRAKAGETVTA